MKLWFAIRCDGVESFRTMIRTHVALTGSCRVGRSGRAVRDRRAAPALNLLCIALRDGDPNADAATDALIEAANATRTALFTRTVLDGRSVLRVSIGGRRTTETEVRSAWGLLQALA